MNKFTTRVKKIRETSLQALLIVSFLSIFSNNISAQVVIFSENVGTPSGTPSIALYTGWQNYGTLTYIGSGDVRSTTPSIGYSGASGDGNVFITNVLGRDFQISGVNSSTYSGLALTFGIVKSTTASNGSDLILEVSSDGVTYTPVAFPSLPTGSGTAIWHQRTTTGTIPACSNLRIRFRQNGTTTQYRIDDVVLTGFVGGSLALSPSTLSGFTYAFGAGPSASQTFQLSGSGLSGFPGNILVTGSANYLVSLDNITFGASVNVPFSSASLTATDIYVRLKAGLAVGTYNGELINCSGGGATSVNVTCNGNVTGPTLTASVSSINGMDYLFGAGPSPSVNYSLSGVNLSPAAGNITVGPLASFQFSTDNINFFNSLTLPYAGGVLPSVTIHVRLIAGLAIGAYSGNIPHSGGSASTTVAATGIVNDPMALPTVFSPGDIAVVGVNSNIKCIFADDGADEISFVCFKDINNGTKFFVTDNGYQRVNAGLWGDTEGVYEFTRTGGTIPAGTVITFRFLNITPFMVYVCPDANWTFSKVSGFPGQVVLNTNGDQLYFMQGGTWSNPAGLHNADYSGGTFLFAFNTYSAWVDFGNSTQRSGLIPGMECFSMMPGVATDFIKFTGAVDGLSATTRIGWIGRVNNPLNWVNCGVGSPVDATASCNNYNATPPNYAACASSISITPGGYTAGIWNGAKNTNWFDCANWENLTIPDSTINVVIPAGLYTNLPVIGDPPTVPVAYTSAYCNDITIALAKSLTLDHVNSKLNIFGNFSKSGSISHTNGTIFLNGNTNTVFNGTTPSDLYNLSTVKDALNLTTTLGHNVTVNNLLTLTSGKIITGAQTLTVENNAAAAVVAGTGNTNFANSYVIGFLKRRIATNLATYNFPVGITAWPRLAQFYNSNLTGTQYITCSFDANALTGNTGTLNVIEGSTPLTTICPEGVWQIDPDVQPSGGRYGFKLWFTGFASLSAADDNTFSIIKRPNPVGLGDLGAFTNGGGIISALNGDGRLYSHGYAYKWNLSDFSQFAIAKAGGPLPVELLSFTAECSGEGRLIRWITASELNNEYFTLERSIDGENYEFAAHIKGAGTSNERLHYTTTDHFAYSGTVFYKLTQTDFDGRTESFGPISIICENSDERFEIIQTLVTEGHLEVIYTTPGTQGVVRRLTDAFGQLVFEDQKDGNAGNNKLILDHKLAAGLYILSLYDGNQAIKKKIWIH